MSKFEDRTHKTMGHGSISAIGRAIASLFLAACGIALVAVTIVPAILLTSVAAWTVRWLESRKNGQSHRPIVIAGEYEVLDPGTRKR